MSVVPKSEAFILSLLGISLSPICRKRNPPFCSCSRLRIIRSAIRVINGASGRSGRKAHCSAYSLTRSKRSLAKQLNSRPRLIGICFSPAGLFNFEDIFKLCRSFCSEEPENIFGIRLNYAWFRDEAIRIMQEPLFWTPQISRKKPR